MHWTVPRTVIYPTQVCLRPQSHLSQTLFILCWCACKVSNNEYIIRQVSYSGFQVLHSSACPSVRKEIGTR